jgi:thioredoxin reductase
MTIGAAWVRRGVQSPPLQSRGSYLFKKSWYQRNPIVPFCASMTVANGAATPLEVAVIGAGAAGLVTAREMLREGHRVTILEQNREPGGVWVYTDDVGSVHSSMYANLRTNLPRELMGFASFPFDSNFKGSMDARRFPVHSEVLAYLNAFAARFDLPRHIVFGTKVVGIEIARASSSKDFKWKVTTSCSAESESDGKKECTYDAVVVSTGHYSEPRQPQLPGRDAFPGVQMHSHDYRRPDPFIGKRVLLIGAGNSGADIAQELADVGASAVYLSSRYWVDDAQPSGAQTNNHDASVPPITRKSGITNVPTVASLGADGTVVFANGASVASIDVVLYATGYDYRFPFLKGVPGAPQVDNNRVGPLYKHVFPCNELAPRLSFIGLPFKVAPFPQFELQARWVARCLSGKARLPSVEEMLRDTLDLYAEMEATGVDARFTHVMGAKRQQEYNGWLAEACGEDSEWPEWRDVLYAATGALKQTQSVAYRDVPLVGEGVDDALCIAVKTPVHA